MDRTMADHQIPTEGWVALVAAALGAKPLWDYLTRRKALEAAQERERAEHSQEIELRKLTADEERDHKLIRLLERQVKELRDEVKELRGKVEASAADKVLIATQAAEITRLKEDNARLRRERAHYRSIAETSGEVLADTRPDAAKQILEEISEADEATSQAGGKK